MPLWAISCPGDFPLCLEFLPWAIWQRKFDRHFCTRGERGAAFDKEAASADSAGEAVKLFSLRRGIADFDCERRPWVRAAMGKAGIVIAGEEAVDDLSPWYSSQEDAGGVVDQNIFMFGVNGEVFPLMASRGDDGIFHRVKAFSGR